MTFDGWDLVAEPPPLERDFQRVIVAGRPFAVPLDAVRGQIGAVVATRVPGAKRCVRGVLMWQGQVVPVLATSLRLSLPVLRPPASGYPLLGLEVGGETFFLEVDAIEEQAASGRLEPSPGDIPMIAGFIDADGERLPVIDLDALTDLSEAGP